MKHLKHTTNKTFKKAVAFVTSVTMLASSLCFPEISEDIIGIFDSLTASADTSTVYTEELANLKELYEFSKKYHDDPAAYARYNLVITFDTSEGGNEITSTKTFDGETLTWYPLGTKNAPFNGRVVIAITKGTTQSIVANAPIFGYITDSVEIVNVNPENNKYTFQDITLMRTEAGDSPLFAEHVVHDGDSSSTPATWSLNVQAAASYAGIIGTVGDSSADTAVSIDLRLDESADISTADNAGLVCGTICEDSSVKVNFLTSTSVNSVDVTSTDGAAGGFVGEMKNGSSLDIITNGVYDVSSASRAVTGKTYAGGLVGKNDRGTVRILTAQTSGDNTTYTENTYEALGTVTATDGAAGGVFGYFKVRNDDNRFSPDYYRSTDGCILGGKTAGALVGELDGNGVDISYSGVSDSERLAVKSQAAGSHTTYGGIVGSYANSSLAKSFTVKHTDVTVSGGGATNYGGAVGALGGSSAVYVYADDFTLKSTGNVNNCSYFGGVVGTAGSKGSMLDMGNIKITTTNKYKGGGVVGQLSAGVLRLSGTTDLLNAEASSGGQLVGERKNALVYALGSGEDAQGTSYGTGWRFVRSNGDAAVDDIGVWGEVVRIDGVESGIITYDPTAHTATVAAAVTAMTSPTDFVKTALNMQLNDGANEGALCFAEKSAPSRRSELLANKTLTLSGTINLAGTGITGFMRDGAINGDTAEIKYFTGKLSGSSDATVKLAVGERYGVYSGSANGRGAIHRHKFAGLFSRTGDGAELSDITIDGYMNIRASSNDLDIGGAVAYLENAATLTNVKAVETINYDNLTTPTAHRVGGLVGRTNCSAGKNVVLQGSSADSKVLVAPTINIGGNGVSNVGDDGGTNKTVKQAVGGVIGYIANTKKATTTVKNITLSAKVDASAASEAGYVSTAGLIADIAYYENFGTDTRTLDLADIDIKDTIIKNNASNASGGILGYRWPGTDVTFSNVKLISGDGTNELNTKAKFIGGLVYKATGRWTVGSKGLDISSLAIMKGTSAAAPTSLGMIVHDGYIVDGGNICGIFLEMTASDSYNLASGMTVPTMSKNYDELVYALSKDEASVLTNDTAGVISYRTNGAYSMNGAGTRNSYNNVYNKTVVNNRSRYYYNADSVSYAASTENGYKLLYWSLNRYAASNLKRCFTNPFATDIITGTFNLKGISYYPIDISKKVTISDASIQFWNDNIENTETASDTKRSTRSSSTQHYLMHMGLFRNVTSTVETTGNITLYGTVGVDSVYSGALINGKLTGSLITSANKTITLGYFNKKNWEAIPLELSGANADDRFMLINSIGSKAVLDLNGLIINPDSEYETYDGYCYASSLIGDVQGVGITLKFNNIMIDARDNIDTEPDLYDIYGTDKSIFKNATLLNKYDVDPTSVAIYNFSQAEDWESSSSHQGSVTYGKELTDTVEYKDITTELSEEDRYYEDGENGHYIDPSAYPGVYPGDTVPANSAYSFSSGYLPYVRYYNISEAPNGYSPVYSLREIKVNVVPSDLRSGCGTYDHPYEIAGTKQLKGVADMLDGTENIPNIMLPLDKTDTSHWCLTESSQHSCKLFTLEGTEYTAAGTDVKWQIDEVRRYLAGAYYQISQSFVIPANGFNGLGGYDSEYAFKGVIVGMNENITITNKSAVPLIKVSNGSVVKNLKIAVDNKAGDTHTSVLTEGNLDTKFSYENNNLVYGSVIGKIMGGDNIIDNVSVTFANGGYIQVPSNNYLHCVGGYVGVVVNGGLVFRNMTESSFVSKNTFKVSNSSAANSANYVLDTDLAHLYINPYVGRVINGYVINETEGDDASYSGDSGEYTLDNSTKNYRIPDVIADVGDSAKLYYDTFESKNRVNIPDGQSLFMLSLITQTGAGTATTADGDYVYGVAYDCASNANRYDADSAAKNAATHLAKYTDVGGELTYADKTQGDYYLSTGDMKNSSAEVPYIIQHYTKADSDGNYPARMMTGNTEFMQLTVSGGTYELPECFRGIGSICRFKGGDKTSIDIWNNGKQDLYNKFIGRYIDGDRLRYNWEQSGVNGIVDEDGKFSMKIYGFEGNGATIDVRLDYNTYADNKNNGSVADNYNNTIYTNGNINVAFGLFNYVKQKSNATTTLNNALAGTHYRPETSTIPNYNLTSGYYIGNFTLTGYVKVKEYDKSKNLQGESPKRTYKDQAMYRHSVGGVIGATTVNDYVNFFKLDLVDFDVEGAANVGGYIGRNNVTERNVDYGNGMNYIYANACDTQNLTVKCGGGYCGGFIAGGLSGYLDLFVNTAPNSGSSDAEHKGTDGYYKSTMEMSVSNNTNVKEFGTGGVLGSLRNGYMVNIWINNVTVRGADENSVISNSTATATDTIGVGGLVGFVRKADTVILTNCTVENINISGPVAGGLTGCISKEAGFVNFGLPPVMKVYNCNVIDNDEADEFGIVGILHAGGLCGNFLSDQTYKTADNAKGYDYDPEKNNVYRYDIDGCEVSDYQIKVTNNSDAQLGSGGIIGYAANATRTVVNSCVHDCSIMIDGTSDKHGMGGIIGNTETAVWGYNMAAYNNTFSYANSGTKAKCGGFIGNSRSNALKIAGFTRKNNTLASSSVSRDVGDTASSSSYVICADYMNVSTGEDHGTSMAVGFDNGENVGPGGGTNDGNDYFPYVTVSPKVGMGGPNFLTGDGVSIVDSSPIAKLIAAESGGTAADNRISYATIGAQTSDIALVNEMITRGEDTTQDYDIKLTTYGREMGLPEGLENDFPIIAINGGVDNYNSYINAYIRTLTNTTDDYSVANASKFVVDIYPCQYIDGAYRRVSGTQGFRLVSKKFRMYDDDADSIAGNNQVSMIDIRFLDPTDKNKTAYHLYIPVLTKKLLKFDFDSSALQGTKYEPSDYISKFPTEPGASSKLAAGFDSWQTVFVRFTYTTEEINKFLTTGKGLNWNTSKTLYFNYGGKQTLAPDTEFVLLDNNFNVDKEYYKKKIADDTVLSSGRGQDIIRFADFAARDGEPFTPQTLNSIADKKVVYAVDSSGAYVKCSETDKNMVAYAYDSTGNNKLFFKKRTNENSGRYTLSISSDIEETYYLSMYAYKKDNYRAQDSMTATVNDAYGFEVTCPMTFASNVITCQKNAEHNTNIYLGEFLSQTMTMTNVTPRQPMSATGSSTIKATMTSEISFGGENAAYFHRNLVGEKIYQGFYLYLNRYDIKGSIEADCTIKGQPSYKYTRSVDGEPLSGETVSVVEEGAPYLEFTPIEIEVPEYVIGVDWKSTQSVSTVIDYGANDAAIIKEFPANTGAVNDGRGIGFEGKSRIDFAETRVKYSNRIKNEKRTERYFVDRSSIGGALTLTAIDQQGNDGYDLYGEQSHNKSPLGVNGNYIRTGSLYDASLGDLEYIKVGMDYDVSNLTVEEIFDGHHDLDIKIELEKKITDPDSPEGFKYVPVNIDDTGGEDTGYLSGFKFYDRSGTGALPLISAIEQDDDGNDYCCYTYSMTLDPDTINEWPIQYTDTGTQRAFAGNFDFYVKTGDALEAIDDYLYSNYRVKMTVSISGTKFTATDCVVYTNARINAQFVKAS